MTTGSSSNTGPTHKLVEAGITLLDRPPRRDRDRRQPEGRHQLGRGRPPRRLLSVLHRNFHRRFERDKSVDELREDNDELFAEWGQLRQVMSVVVPTAIYVGVMPFTGLGHLASIVFIAWFMRWLGKYPWLTVLAVSLGMPIVPRYSIFERWFLVPLPKGPVEEWLDL